MTIRNCMIFGALVLLGVGTAAGQLGTSGTLGTGIETRGDVTFGDIALEVDDSRRVVMAIDSNGEDGLADLMIAFEAEEPVEGLDTFRGYGLVRMGSKNVTLNLPDLQETLLFSTDGEAPFAAEVHRVPVRRFLNGQSLKIWRPQPTHLLSLGQALTAELRSAAPEVRTLPAGIFQQDPGGGSTGGCAASCSVTCHDGTSCSVNCTSGKCAQCSCPNAACWCTEVP